MTIRTKRESERERGDKLEEEKEKEMLCEIER